MTKPDDKRDERFAWYRGFAVWHSYTKPEYYAYMNGARLSAQNYDKLRERMDLRASYLEGGKRWKK